MLPLQITHVVIIGFENGLRIRRPLTRRDAKVKITDILVDYFSRARVILMCVIIIRGLRVFVADIRLATRRKALWHRDSQLGGGFFYR